MLTIFFSDGSNIELSENDVLSGIMIVDNDTKPADMTDEEFKKEQWMYPKLSKIGDILELWNHTQFGLVPQLTTILFNYPFFCKSDDTSTWYSSQNIVKIVSR